MALSASSFLSAAIRMPTPALVLDATLVRNNIHKLANYASRVGLQIRPHTKTHKQKHLARLQIEAGAVGVAAAKVSEAEAISDPNHDVLLAYPPIGATRSERLAMLARDRMVRAAVDSIAAVKLVSEAAHAAQTTIGLLVDLDVGLRRTGVQSPTATLPLAQAIDRASNVRLDGIMVYPGHIWKAIDKQEEELNAIDDLIGQTLELWTQHGLAATIISGGSTPTAYQSHFVRHLTEIRPGTYIFNDMNTVRGGYCELADCAARVVATVISNAVTNQVVIDAGSKTLTNDVCISAPNGGFGHVVEYPAARITRLSEDHGQIDVTACRSQPAIGERVTTIPNHVCPCVNLQDTDWWVEPDDVPRQIKVEARGKLT